MMTKSIELGTKIHNELERIQQEGKQLRHEVITRLQLADLAVEADGTTWEITYRGHVIKAHVRLFQPRCREHHGTVHPYWAISIEPLTTAGRRSSNRTTVRGKDQSFTPSLAIKHFITWLERHWQEERTQCQQDERISQEKERGLPEGIDLYASSQGGFDVRLYQVTDQQLTELLALVRRWADPSPPRRQRRPMRLLGDPQLDQCMS
jgi:hypothetical protein